MAIAKLKTVASTGKSPMQTSDKIHQPVALHDEVASSAVNAAIENSVLGFIGSYLALMPSPSPAQIQGLAQAIGCDVADLQVIVAVVQGDVAAVAPAPTDLMTDTGLRGNPGVNIPGDLDAFSGEDINPIGTTNLVNLEVPESFNPAPSVGYQTLQPSQNTPSIPGGGTRYMLRTSKSKLAEESSAVDGDGFLADMDEPLPREVQLLQDRSVAPATTARTARTVHADLSPHNTKTGIDDGAPESYEDDLEQQALIDDGFPSSDIPDEPDTQSALNNDGFVPDTVEYT